jgi:hypothetical protein
MRGIITLSIGILLGAGLDTDCPVEVKRVGCDIIDVRILLKPQIFTTSEI